MASALSRPVTRRKLVMLIVFALFLAPLLARAMLYTIGNAPRSWRDADWSSTHLCRRRASTSWRG